MPDVEPISPALGAIVAGVDLSGTLTDDDVLRIRACLDRYLVVFFRGQRLTAVQQRDAAARFGALYTHPFYPGDPSAPEIMVLESGAARRATQNNWHSDVTYIERPPHLSLLYGDIIPPSGGDTLWASMYAAYDALSPALRRALDGLHGVHDFAKDFPPERFAASGVAGAPEALYAAHPPVSHPVFLAHPVTGRGALYVNSSFTSRIAEMTQRESSAVLGLLFDHIEQPEFQIRWRWSTGDVALWDNRSTQHYAVSDYYPARRRTRRATILGERS